MKQRGRFCCCRPPRTHETLILGEKRQSDVSQSQLVIGNRRVPSNALLDRLPKGSLLSSVVDCTIFEILVSFPRYVNKMFGSYKDTPVSPTVDRNTDSSEAEPFILSETVPHWQKSAWQTYLTALHAITTVVLAFICTGLLIHEQRADTGTFEQGFNTELSTYATFQNYKTFN